MSKPTPKPKPRPVGKPRRDPSGIVRQIAVKVTPTVYDFYAKLGAGNAGRAARETLERVAAEKKR